MSQQGWIKVHRQIKENWIYNDKPFDRTHAWIDLVIKANHQGKKIALGNEIIDIERGSFVTSELKLMESFGWSKTKLRNFLKLLKEDGMIEIKSDKKKTTVTIVNYNVYQDSENHKETTEEPQEDHEETTKEPRKDTNKNDKNKKNDNNDNNDKGLSEGVKPINKFLPPTIEEIKEYCISRKNNIDAEKFINFYASKGWMIGKNKMKDWKAAVRTWEKGGNSFGTNVKQDNGTVQGANRDYSKYGG